jgi:NhaA family Na+:H+ antiporter
MSMAAHAHIPTAAAELPPSRSERLTRPFQRFSELASAGGILLLLCTVIAVWWANSAFADSYHHLFHEMNFSVALGAFAIEHHVIHWINDGLMVIFFFYVGMEIKREIMVGELSDVKKAALPIVGAIGGMTGPALIYAALNFQNAEAIKGWGVPTATDIAFAVGLMAMLGSRVPNSLKIFLTSLAIADDLGALVIIALFYTEKLNFAYLGYGAGILGLLFALNLLGFRRTLWYLIPGVVLWYFIAHSGIHATIAGVLIACAVPASSRVDAGRYLSYTRNALDTFERASSENPDVRSNSDQRAAVFAIRQNGKYMLPLLHRLEHFLGPWCTFLIIPVFALANAGTHFEGSIVNAFSDTVTLGVTFGLFIGKPVGIVLFAYLACKVGLAALPRGVTWKHMIGAGCFGGIGFTMALFVATLAFKGNDHLLGDAKIGIFTASILSTIVGSIILWTCKPVPEPEPETLGPALHKKH